MKFCLTAQQKRVAYSVQSNPHPTPLVLLHGFCEDHSVWEAVLPMLKTAGLVLVDLPGFGQSEPAGDTDMLAYAEAVLAVLDQEKTERCVLVGHSMGGYAALEFAARWPERLAGLGLFHSHPFVDSEERKMARTRGIETLRAGKRDIYVTQLFPNLFATIFVAQHPELLNQLISKAKEQSAEGIIAALEAMLGRRDHAQTLAALPCPALFFLGKEDTLVLPEQGLQAALLPAVAEIQLSEGLAHMGMWENPEVSARVLRSFWDFCQS